MSLSIRFIVYRRAPDEGAPRKLSLTDLPAGDCRLGAGPDCGVLLPDLGGQTLAVLRRGKAFAVSASAPEPPVTVNGKPLPPGGELALRNGDRIACEPYQIHFLLQFSLPGGRRRRALLPIVTGSLIAAIILTELFLVNWLPRQVSKVEMGGEELLRQRINRLLDTQRASIDKSLDPRQRGPANAALLLVKDELNSLANYLRDHGGSMSRADLKTTFDDLAVFDGALAAIQQGRMYPPTPSLDTLGTFQNLQCKDPRHDPSPSPAVH